MKLKLQKSKINKSKNNSTKSNTPKTKHIKKEKESKATKKNISSNKINSSTQTNNEISNKLYYANKTKTTPDEKNGLFKNLSYVWQSIKMNYIFWIAMMGSLILITKYDTQQSYSNTFITFILAILLGWYIHYLSHAYDLYNLYSSADNFIVSSIRKVPLLDKIIKNTILYSTDFHDKIHHNSEINRNSLHLVFEFFQNIFMEGGLLLILANNFNFSIKMKGSTFKFNKAVLFLWGLLYATVHNINYIILGNEQHSNHHVNPKTNYGIDILDILFDTKYDIKNIENTNHAAINIVIITLLIIYFKIYLE